MFAGRIKTAPLHAAGVLIFGATGGLGQALVRALCAMPEAKRPSCLYLCGRQQQVLSSLLQTARKAGISAAGRMFDLRERMQTTAVLQQAIAAGVSKVVIASGISLSAGADGLEDAKEIQRGFAVNTCAPCEIIHACAQLLPPGSQVIAISSLAARLALPSSPVYCASKAALNLYAAAMRPHFAARGLVLSVAEPGFFTSPMSERYQGSKMAELSASDAAGRILHLMQSGRAYLAFPRCLALGIDVLKCLPEAVRICILQRFFAFTVRPDAERQKQISAGGLK